MIFRQKSPKDPLFLALVLTNNLVFDPSEKTDWLVFEISLLVKNTSLLFAIRTRPSPPPPG